MSKFEIADIEKCTIVSVEGKKVDGGYVGLNIIVDDENGEAYSLLTELPVGASIQDIKNAMANSLINREMISPINQNISIPMETGVGEKCDNITITEIVEENNNIEGESSEIQSETETQSESGEESSSSGESSTSSENDNGEPASGAPDESPGPVDGSSDESSDAPGSDSDGGPPDQGDGEPQLNPEGQPSLEWLKADLKAYMDVNGIAYNSGDTKEDLISKIEGA